MLSENIYILYMCVVDDGSERKHDWKIIFIKHDVIHVFVIFFCNNTIL